jgi:hypothetical protein
MSVMWIMALVEFEDDRGGEIYVETVWVRSE